MDANNRRERIAEEAAEWWVTLQGEVTRAEREQYVDWLRESGLHVAEILRIAQVHGALKQFERWSKIPTDGPSGDEDVIVPLPGSEPQKSARHSPNRTARRVTFVLAAMVACTAIGLSTFLVSRQGQVIETARGERREVALSDGSVVQVDPETRLRVKFESERRLVFLERGRALFHVAKNKERPFFVEADDTTVRAVGTAFGVERNSESVVVTVSEGRVAVIPTAAASSPKVASDSSPGEVRRDGSAEAPHRAASKATGIGGSNPPVSMREGDNDRAEILLDAGEQVTVGESGSAQPVQQVDSTRALAWAEGRLVFENDSVQHVVEEFNRYNRIQLEVRDAELAKRPVSGTFSAADPESFVAFLQTVTSVRISRDAEGNTVIDAAR